MLVVSVFLTDSGSMRHMCLHPGYSNHRYGVLVLHSLDLLWLRPER